MVVVVVVVQIPQGKSKDGALAHIFFCREALGNGTTVFAQRFWLNCFSDGLRCIETSAPSWTFR